MVQPWADWGVVLLAEFSVIVAAEIGKFVASRWPRRGLRQPLSD
ncbi:MAG: hypothetical protein Q7T04_08140 [Dehalococcoidia bacterium]|nr:hypothetical protein [Dehalococcoidia bacterium]